jgi:hypothetical protein
MNSSLLHFLPRLLSVVITACPILLISTVSVAFGPYPVITAVDVNPWVPKPSEHVVLSIADTLSGEQENGTGLVGVQTVRIGNVFNVMATLAYGATQGNNVNGVVQFTVDLGTLPEGRYTANYASNGANFMVPGAQDVTLTFTVASTYPSAIEYFDKALGHYFYTSDPNEIASLDLSTGWARTGQSFHVVNPEIGRNFLWRVCRFYGLPQAGLDSHFFTSDEAECAYVQYYWSRSWLLETDNAFMVPPGYECGGGTIPLYRVYNNRPDANHRYTTSLQTRNDMAASGWIVEGEGLVDYPEPHVMCVPQ